MYNFSLCFFFFFSPQNHLQHCRTVWDRQSLLRSCCPKPRAPHSFFLKKKKTWRADFLAGIICSSCFPFPSESRLFRLDRDATSSQWKNTDLAFSGARQSIRKKKKTKKCKIKEQKKTKQGNCTRIMSQKFCQSYSLMSQSFWYKTRLLCFLLQFFQNSSKMRRGKKATPSTLILIVNHNTKQ